MPVIMSDMEDRLFRMANKEPISAQRRDHLILCALFDEELSDAEKAYLMELSMNKHQYPSALFEEVVKGTFDALAQAYNQLRYTPTRKERSEAVIATFQAEDDVTLGNHLFHNLWLPWAKKVVFVSSGDCCLWASDYGAEAETLRSQQKTTSWAIPTIGILKYMVRVAPKITELGAGKGYWTKLLRKVGGHVTAVDDKSENIAQRPLIRDLIVIDAVRYVSSGKADDSAIFLCYPRMKSSGGVWVERAFEHFKGNNIFYVGELGFGSRRGSTFEILDWLKDTGEALGWRVKTQKVLPSFCGIFDEFVHLQK